VVDAAHGGDERGAALTAQIAEKDVTLAFARSLRQQLEARGLPTLLLRDGDTTLTPDQRAAKTNSADPAIYICLHAASQGSGVRLYTALTPGTESRGPFLAWSAAQIPFEQMSQLAEASVAAELRSKQVPVRALVAPLRPLSNIAAAAAAIEVTAPANDISQLNSPEYQQMVMNAVAAGLANVRDKLVVAKQ
jgi:N-acetylmuramoyl-L-alanine amidase